MCVNANNYLLKCNLEAPHESVLFLWLFFFFCENSKSNFDTRGGSNFDKIICIASLSREFIYSVLSYFRSPNLVTCKCSNNQMTGGWSLCFKHDP